MDLSGSTNGGLNNRNCGGSDLNDIIIKDSLSDRNISTGTGAKVNYNCFSQKYTTSKGGRAQKSVEKQKSFGNG